MLVVVADAKTCNLEVDVSAIATGVGVAVIVFGGNKVRSIKMKSMNRVRDLSAKLGFVGLLTVRLLGWWSL